MSPLFTFRDKNLSGEEIQITKRTINDDSQDDLDFNIYFNLTNDFEDLNDDWDFISFSETKLELIDVSGGNGGTDYLTLEKN